MLSVSTDTESRQLLVRKCFFPYAGSGGFPLLNSLSPVPLDFIDACAGGASFALYASEAGSGGGAVGVSTRHSTAVLIFGNMLKTIHGVRTGPLSPTYEGLYN